MTRKPSARRGGSLGPEDPAFYQALGRAIRVARTERGLERKDLAEAAGVSYPYLSDIESGRGRPSSRALLTIAKALGMPLHDLLRKAELLAPSMQSESQQYAGRALRMEAPSALAPPSLRARSWFGTASERLELGSAAVPSPLSARDELEALLNGLSADDLELVLRFVRRLGRQG